MGIAERKNRQKQALRERILDAARRIVMREGFAALSMRKIADAIEYSPATLYLHFASRDEIAQALCAEGYAHLLETFVPLAGIADPAERLKALGRAYVAFGVAHPETYRLIFMEDPSYTDAALSGAVKGKAADPANAGAASRAAATREDPDATTADEASSETAATEADPGEAALHLMISALDELKAAGRLPASMDVAVWAEAFWANLHGIVALNLTCPVFPTAPLDTVVGVALDAWLGASRAEQVPTGAVASAGTRKKKSPETRTGSAAQPDNHRAAQPLAREPAKAAASGVTAPPARRKTTSA
ncbi:TetR/AcrR family transcriptional regulator [Paraburkholderia dipogonis]|uniref:TetR/AcrR family transcriptional regulator n=1 Tax=Paraburkholderia dipogonis TaxID=1211383 RepID=A0A4Y8N3Q5_9BURK|nr:TetR/AcrR family transcriptional regulator [Paraburkholderia dipogonis]TFE44437.1 TetR/AcrR family transcriptional regulator [Paraburkholderia dipogonis]